MKVRWKAARLAEVRSLPPNPWRGLYAIYPFMISGEETAEASPPLRPEHSLCLVEINLFPFRQEMLSDAALEQIDRIFAWFKEQRREMILRFLYDWDGNGLQNEPESISLILGHMRQLSPLLSRYADCIYTLQGLFVGSWGEMHGSRHTGAQSLIMLTQALDDAAEGRLLLAVRCPNQWREIFQTYDPPLEERVFDGKLRSRVGLFNDAILASDTDYGTYGQASRAQAAHYGTKRNREEELTFQDRLCIGVPNGGELVQGEGGFSLAETYRIFRRMRLSYLNADFDMDAINRLRGEANIARSRVWRGADAFAYLAGHLGYRFSVSKLLVKRTTDGLRVQVLMENTGFACCYFPLKAMLYVQTADGFTALTCPIPADTRNWQPGEKIWLTAQLQSGGLAQGEYRVELGVSDPRSGKPVYLASAARGEGVRQTLLLGTLQVRKR